MANFESDYVAFRNKCGKMLYRHTANPDRYNPNKPYMLFTLGSQLGYGTPELVSFLIRAQTEQLGVLSDEQTEFRFYHASTLSNDYRDRYNRRRKVLIFVLACVALFAAIYGAFLIQQYYAKANSAEEQAVKLKHDTTCTKLRVEYDDATSEFLKTTLISSLAREHCY